jgi:hypothetical protein
MALLLIFISGFISSYFFLTDPARIKAMSQSYLSSLVGGHVQIGAGSLTIFEGLKLSHVAVTVDDGKAPDSTLFFADNIEIQYNPASLLRGRLEATRIIATGAKVKLVEDSARGRWNYQRLAHQQGKPAVTQPSQQKPPLLPELDLRDAEVEYSEMQNGACVPRGSVTIEGRLFPSAGGTLYRFDLQSRGAIEGVGPVVAGYVRLKNGEVNATLSHLQFGPDLEAMLPREVRDLWIAHQVEGALDIPDFRYTPATANHRATFRLQTVFKDVQLIIRSEEFTDAPMPDISSTSPLAKFPRLAIAQTEARRLVHWAHPLPQRPPIRVSGASGGFVFDENGIRFDNVTETIAGATLSVSGKVGGYTPDAPIWLRVESKPGQLIEIPEHPDYLASLPTQLHQLYAMLQPHGSGTLWAELNRPDPAALPQVTGEINIVNGAFQSIFFPYPIHGARGKVVFGPDAKHTFEQVMLEDIHGHGAIGGPNENADLRVSGWVGANADDGCRLRVRARDVASEPAVFTALPPPVRKVMTIFKGPDQEPYPHFAGDFDCNVVVPPGVEMRPIVSVDLNFKHGGGKLTDFPYPLENMTGQVLVRDGYVDLKDVHFTHGRATVSVDGRVTWPVGLPPDATVIAKPDVHLVAHNVAVDNDLLKALPAEARRWLRTIGASGTLDVDGQVIPKAGAVTADKSIDFNLDVLLRDGAAHPLNTDFTLTDAVGKLVVHSDSVQVLNLQGRRADAVLTGAGSVDWSTGQPKVRINASATRLILDEPLRQLLPAAAQQAWVSLDPHGVVNGNVSYSGVWSTPPGEPLVSLNIPADAIGSMPQIATDDFKIEIEPTDVTVTARPLPYQLQQCTGKITVTPRDISIESIHARHGNATIELSGRGATANPNDWDLTLRARNMPADDDLKKALPSSMRQVLDELKYTGKVSVDLTNFRYRGEKPDPDVDLTGTFTAGDASIDVGVPIDKIDGSVTFNAAVRGGKLAAFRGNLDVAQMSLADRPMKNLSSVLNMPAKSDVLTASELHGQLAGGELAGRMDLKFPDSGPASYLLDFEVKNADLREMAQQVAPKGQQIRGQVSASLALQGEWSDPTTRRGRGDVLVTGKEIYQIPLLLGLLEVTNLSLPTSSPFSEGTARYLVEGNRINFERVQMRSDSMVMSGNGWLDFGSKLVRMNFTTENPHLPQLPLIHDLWEGAKQELLQIQVRGTVQKPKVSAGALHTFTTTVDEVFSGNGTEK